MKTNRRFRHKPIQLYPLDFTQKNPIHALEEKDSLFDQSAEKIGYPPIED
jgi:hypothetical protein